MVDAPKNVIETVEQLVRTTAGLSVCHEESIPATKGEFAPLPDGLHSELSAYLSAAFPGGLFKHQRAAVDSLRANRHTVVATRTSSGKSLIYAIPVLDRLLAEPDATALFLFPQKALANDQLQRLITTVDQIPTLRAARLAKKQLIARYDGATFDELKPSIRAESQVLMTNPDMLHYGLLAWHERHWQRFFKRLRYVVIDECHDYRGIFGTNVSYLFRRLVALCRQYGSAPTFVATSATVQDPQGHMERLTGQPFTCVGSDQDGSQQGARKFWMVQPAEEHPYDAGRKLTLALAEKGLTVLTFCLSRTAAEKMMARAGRDNKDAESPFVRVYRAGLTPSEREEIEAGLRDRSVRAVFSTSALELGIDIGALDAVVCVGLPHTMMSLYQRAGRAGRGDREGAIILIPGETPIDAYHAAHPRELFARDHEPLVLNLSNQRVLHHHYACAAKEAGDESRMDFTALGSEMASVKAERDAGLRLEEVFYLSEPHRSVRIRGSGDEAYQLRCDGTDVGEIDTYHLLREAPRNGIYFHGGTRYRVQDVIAGNKQVRLARELTHNTTTSTIGTSIRDRRLSAIRQTGRVVVARAVIDVNDYLISVTEKNPAGTTVRVHNGSGGMPNNWLPTEGTMLRLEQPLWNEIAGRLGDGPARAALEATARLFESLFPTVTGPCDRSDFSAAAIFPKNGPVALYLYDAIPYGVGLTVGASDRIGELVDRAAEQVRGCTCTADEGCFRCVRNPHAEQQASKANTLALLEIISQELRVPPVTLPPPVDQPPAQGNGEQTAQAKQCRTCGVAHQIVHRYCFNCGSKLEGSS